MRASERASVNSGENDTPLEKAPPPPSLNRMRVGSMIEFSIEDLVCRFPLDNSSRTSDCTCCYRDSKNRERIERDHPG